MVFLRQYFHGSSPTQNVGHASYCIKRFFDPPKGIGDVESDSKLEGEIARAAHPLIVRQGGAILLEEVYCAVNRARGTKLVAPDEVYQAAKGIEKKYPQGGVVYHCYPSGIKVLKDATLSDEAISGQFLTA